MAESLPSPASLLEAASYFATLAGRLVLGYFGSSVGVGRKVDGSAWTQVDLDAEDLLRHEIHRTFPEHGIVGEERGEEFGTEPIRWIIDPIDGTETFIRGVPLFGTLIGVELLGEPVVGVIVMPALAETITAARGSGCTWNGRPCFVSCCDRLDQALVVTSDQTTTQREATGFARIAANSAFQRTWGDCYGYALLATGRAEIVLDSEMSLWDSAPLITIVEEAGGKFTDWKGQRTYTESQVLATNGVLHGIALELLGSI